MRAGRQRPGDSDAEGSGPDDNGRDNSDAGPAFPPVPHRDCR